MFAQLAAAIASAITDGRLRAGDRLPGTRTLASTLGLHRNTVIAAFDELGAEGWVETRRGRGSYVASGIPSRTGRGARTARGRGLADRPSYSLASIELPHGPQAALDPRLIRLGGGSPDPRLAPTALIARAYRRALSRHGRLLDYDDGRGSERLRSAIAVMLRTERGLAIEADDVLITRGSQQAISLAAEALVAPGDRVAVESLGYRDAWSAFRAAGAKLVGVSVDESGLDVDRLATICGRRSIRAVYLTPHHHYPTLAVLAPARRLELLRLAKQARIAIVEDDYDNEFHWAGSPVLPLAARDRDGSVIYVGTLSKILAPGLRIGYAVAPRPMLERMTALRIARDRQGDHVLETAIAEIIEDGELARHARKMKKIYGARRELLASELGNRLPDQISFEMPAGGLALWVRLAAGLDAVSIAEQALERGVWVTPAKDFALDGRSRPFLRLGFAGANSDEIRSGVATLAAVIADGPQH